MWGLDPIQIHGSFWRTGINVLNGITIGSAAFAGLTVMTDRQTDTLLRL